MQLMNLSKLVPLPKRPGLNHSYRTCCLAIGFWLILLSLRSFGNDAEILETNWGSIRELEDRLDTIDQRLANLANYNLRSGVGAIGYRSRVHPDPDHLEWLEVELPGLHKLDEIVLVPTILREETSGFAADAFPSEMRVVVGRGMGEDRKVVHQFHVSVRSSNRIAPFFISVAGIEGSWVRIECNKLAQRPYDGRYLFQFAELFVFSDGDNLALNQPVITSSDGPTGSAAWGKEFAVDGFVPYLMSSVLETGSSAFVNGNMISVKPTFFIDLDEVHEVSAVRLHLVDQADTVPQSFSGDFGFPKHLTVKGALSRDFSGAQVLTEMERSSVFDVGPIITLKFEPKKCRFVQFVATKPYTFVVGQKSVSRFGFAEVEIFAAGKNQALGKQVSISSGQAVIGSLSAITDGKNRYGKILPLRDWMSQLSERYALEQERPVIAAVLRQRYQHQSKNQRQLIVIATTLALLAVASTLFGWYLRQKGIRQTREQIAADLHDELGANLHAIGLISDLAAAKQDEPDKLGPLLTQIRQLTEKSGKAAKDCVNMLETRGLEVDVVKDIQRNTKRIAGDLNREFTCEVAPTDLGNLNAREKLGLVLFHKECLVNAIRHSNATLIRTSLLIENAHLKLGVQDNGGHDGVCKRLEEVPPSLHRRARLIGGKVELVEHAQSGTHVELSMPLRKSWFRQVLNLGRVKS